MSAYPLAFPPCFCAKPTPPGARTIFAHRGASALAPENTLVALRKAAAVGGKWVELDVDVIGDGTVIVIHDQLLDRTTNRTGSYYDLTAADLADIDAGSWFVDACGRRPFAGATLPTLQAALTVARECGLSVNVELKSSPAGARAWKYLVDAVADLLVQHHEQGTAPRTEKARRAGADAGSSPAHTSDAASENASRILVSSFNPLLLARMRARHPHGDLALLAINPLLRDDWRAYAEDLGVVAINPGNEGLARDRVEEIRALGYGVNVWTVNGRQRAEELFSWGVSGIFTDRIHELAKYSASDQRRCEADR